MVVLQLRQNLLNDFDDLHDGDWEHAPERPHNVHVPMRGHSGRVGFRLPSSPHSRAWLRAEATDHEQSFRRMAFGPPQLRFLHLWRLVIYAVNGFVAAQVVTGMGESGGAGKWRRGGSKEGTRGNFCLLNK